MAFVAAVAAAPVAVVLGVLWCFLRGICVPPQRGEPFWTERRFQLLCYSVVVLAVVGLGTVQVVPEWGMQIDEERDFMLSAVCAEGKGCPLIGNEMNQLRIKLGPLNRYLMTLCQLVTPDPRFVLWTILALHALGAAYLAAAGDRLLGFPFGLLAGLSFGTNGVLLDVIAAASNGAWASFFQAGAVAGTLQWLRGEPRGLIVAVTCLAAACQLHGTNLILLPPFVLAAAHWRPPMPRRSVILCALIVAALYSSWFVYQWQTRWSDFFLISTSWMVSQGPPLMHRLARALAPLNWLLAPVALWGAVALAAGRGAAPSERKGGRLVALFLALQLVAMLLAGGNWNTRYSAPMVAPGALATAAGLQRLASLLSGGRRLERPYGLAMAGVGLALICALIVWDRPLRSGLEIAARSRSQLTLAEQIEAIRVLGEHGFGAGDLESRVHGSAWDRWDGGQVYLGKWLIGAASRAKVGEHVVIVECDEVPADLASWQHSLTGARPLPHLLVGYDTQLAPVKVEFSTRDRAFWTSERAVPFYGQMVHGGDAQLRSLFDPRLAYPPEFSDLQAHWPSNQPLEMRLTTTLAPGLGDRLLTLSHDPGLAATLTLDGTPRAEVEPATPLGDSAFQRHLVQASERDVEMRIEAKIKLPAGTTVPVRVDLYEEPPCQPGAVAG